MADDSLYVTKLEHLQDLRELDKKIGEATQLAAELVIHRNEREQRSNAMVYERTILSLDKQITDLNVRLDQLGNRLDKFFLAIIGVAITSLISAVIMLAGILMGSI
jgi:SMC interacting uncharacterized protein involved in chromosome segregation